MLFMYSAVRDRQAHLLANLVIFENLAEPFDLASRAVRLGSGHGGDRLDEVGRGSGHVEYVQEAAVEVFVLGGVVAHGLAGCDVVLVGARPVTLLGAWKEFA